MVLRVLLPSRIFGSLSVRRLDDQRTLGKACLDGSPSSAYPDTMIRRWVGAAIVAAMTTAMFATPASAIPINDPDVVRLGGADRYATAAEVSQFHHVSATTVVVASGMDFPDAVAGSVLAGLMDAPLLLTNPTSLSPATAAEITRLAPSNIIVLGGTGSVSAAVFSSLNGMAPASRIAGTDRYETAVAISQASFADGTADVVVVATGTGFADSLTGGPLAALLNGPVLLTPTGTLPAIVSDEIERLDPASILVVGGNGVVSDAVFTQLNGIRPTTRLWGDDRYETSVAVSQYGFTSADRVYLASGASFPDALSGAAAAAALGYPVLLTATERVPLVVRDEVIRLLPSNVVLLGDRGVVGARVAAAIGTVHAPLLSDVDVSFELVATGFDNPLLVTSRAGDTRVYVVEQSGDIWSMDTSGGSRVKVLDVSGDIEYSGERGLLGAAFDPADPSRLYVDYTASGTGATAIVEYAFPLADAAANATPVRTVLWTPQPYSNHNGGMLAFGPDGYLYVAMGDGGSGGDPQDNGQNPNTLLGSILRIDVSDTAPGYDIPADNPYASGGGDPAVWATGVRNPWRLSFDGPILYIGDVGQNKREEADVLDSSAVGGVNLGWRRMEGDLCYPSGAACMGSTYGFADPVFVYPHSGTNSGCAITGGYVYRGLAYPNLLGVYFFADYCNGVLQGMRAYDGSFSDTRVFTGVDIPGLTSFGIDSSGEIYATQGPDGKVWRLVGTV